MGGQNDTQLGSSWLELGVPFGQGLRFVQVFGSIWAGSSTNFSILFTMFLYRRGNKSIPQLKGVNLDSRPVSYLDVRPGRVVEANVLELDVALHRVGLLATLRAAIKWRSLDDGEKLPLLWSLSLSCISITIIITIISTIIITIITISIYNTSE